MKTDIPWSILFIGGITGFIEWQIELKKIIEGNNVIIKP